MPPTIDLTNQRERAATGNPQRLARRCLRRRRIRRASAVGTDAAPMIDSHAAAFFSSAWDVSEMIPPVPCATRSDNRTWQGFCEAAWETLPGKSLQFGEKKHFNP